MRIVFFVLGIGLVVLAAIGVALPLLPTTPFLLLATGCFVRSSPRCAHFLIHSPLFGTLLKDWYHRGIVRPKAKAAAIGSMVLFGGTTLLLGSFAWIVSTTVLAGMALAIGVVIRLPSLQR